ncbi:hypothetical protein ACFL3J_01435 [Candidatus Omnitrophota bacterium]
MKGSFREIISSSFEWTKTVLFKPFNLKKWLLLYVIAALAFQMQGGCNLNNPPSGGGGKSAKTSQVETKGETVKETTESITREPVLAGAGEAEKGGRSFMIFLIVLLVALAFLFFILLEWVYSVFSFVFIESLVRNDASVKEPFRRNKPLGSSFFWWNIIYTTVFLGVLAVLVKLGYDALLGLGALSDGSNVALAEMFFAILPHIIAGIFFVLIAEILSFFVSDYVLPVMYADKAPMLTAFPRAFSLIKKDVLASVKYLFVKIGLSILITIIGGAVGMLLMLGLLIPVLLVGGLLYLLYTVVPAGFQAVYVFILVIVGMPIIVVLTFLVNAVFLPLPVFLKIFNLKFISRLDDRYNLFRATE